MNKRIVVLLILLVLLAISLPSLVNISKKETQKNFGSMYSWHLEKIYEDEEKFDRILNEYEIEVLYQDFSKDYLGSDDDSFIKKMNERGIKVYHLTGDPSWGRENGHNRIEKEIDLIADYNSKVTNKIEGIVLDIEPYVSEMEEKFDRDGFKVYIDQIEKSYEYANEKDVKLIIAIPYWFDSISKSGLEKVIKNSDGVSVMNYRIDNTIKDIKTEVELARKYDKTIDTIYEIKFDQSDRFSSLEEIRNDYKNMSEHFEYDKLRISYHHYESID